MGSLEAFLSDLWSFLNLDLPDATLSARQESTRISLLHRLNELVCSQAVVSGGVFPVAPTLPLEKAAQNLNNRHSLPSSICSFPASNTTTDSPFNNNHSHRASILTTSSLISPENEYEVPSAFHSLIDRSSTLDSTPPSSSCYDDSSIKGSTASVGTCRQQSLPLNSEKSISTQPVDQSPLHSSSITDGLARHSCPPSSDARVDCCDDIVLSLPKRTRPCSTSQSSRRRLSAFMELPSWTLAGSLYHLSFGSSKWSRFSLCLLSNRARLLAYRSSHSIKPSLDLSLCGLSAVDAGTDWGRSNVIKLIWPASSSADQFRVGGGKKGPTVVVLAADTSEQATVWLQQLNQYGQGLTPTDKVSFITGHRVQSPQKQQPATSPNNSSIYLPVSNRNSIYSTSTTDDYTMDRINGIIDGGGRSNCSSTRSSFIAVRDGRTPDYHQPSNLPPPIVNSPPSSELRVRRSLLTSLRRKFLRSSARLDLSSPPPYGWDRLALASRLFTSPPKLALSSGNGSEVKKRSLIDFRLTNQQSPYAGRLTDCTDSIEGRAALSIPGYLHWTVKWCRLQPTARQLDLFAAQDAHCPLFSLPLGPRLVDVSLACSDRKRPSAIKLTPLLPAADLIVLLFDPVDRTKAGLWIRAIFQALDLVGPRQPSPNDKVASSPPQIIGARRPLSMLSSSVTPAFYLSPSDDSTTVNSDNVYDQVCPSLSPYDSSSCSDPYVPRAASRHRHLLSSQSTLSLNQRCLINSLPPLPSIGLPSGCESVVSGDSSDGGSSNCSARVQPSHSPTVASVSSMLSTPFVEVGSERRTTLSNGGTDDVITDLDDCSSSVRCQSTQTMLTSSSNSSIASSTYVEPPSEDEDQCHIPKPSADQTKSSTTGNHQPGDDYGAETDALDTIVNNQPTSSSNLGLPVDDLGNSFSQTSPSPRRSHSCLSPTSFTPSVDSPRLLRNTVNLPPPPPVTSNTCSSSTTVTSGVLVESITTAGSNSPSIGSQMTRPPSLLVANDDSQSSALLVMDELASLISQVASCNNFVEPFPRSIVSDDGDTRPMTGNPSLVVLATQLEEVQNEAQKLRKRHSDLLSQLTTIQNYRHPPAGPDDVDGSNTSYCSSQQRQYSSDKASSELCARLQALELLIGQAESTEAQLSVQFNQLAISRGSLLKRRPQPQTMNDDVNCTKSSVDSPVNSSMKQDDDRCQDNLVVEQTLQRPTSAAAQARDYSSPHHHVNRTQQHPRRRNRRRNRRGNRSGRPASCIQ